VKYEGLLGSPFPALPFVEVIGAFFDVFGLICEDWSRAARVRIEQKRIEISDFLRKQRFWQPQCR
jgi:hypothetical protein